MLKIVKSDAIKVSILPKTSSKKNIELMKKAWYKESDTIDISPDWRPDNYNEIRSKFCQDYCGENYNPLSGDCLECSRMYEIDKIVTACIKALGEL